MQASHVPPKFPLVWGANAGASYINTIPTTSQIGINAGRASLNDGYPPLNFLPVGSGGVPPFGGDFNGITQQITQWNQWQQAGAPVYYDSVFSAAISGYPQGAVISALTLGNSWLCLVDNNSSDPETGGAGWQAISQGRLILQANLNLYVSTTGSDSNNGLSTMTPFLTRQKAINFVAQRVNLNGYNAIITCASGTYADTFTASAPWVGGGQGNVIIEGQSGSPTSVINNPTTGTAQATAYATTSGAGFTLQYMVMESGTSGVINAIQADQNSEIIIGAGLTFASVAAGSHMAASNGGNIVLEANWSITGSAITHASTTNGGKIIHQADSPTCTITGTPAFSIAFVAANLLGLIGMEGVTWSGAATGARYNAGTGVGVIDSGGGGANYFPGNSAGSSINSWQYV